MIHCGYQKTDTPHSNTPLFTKIVLWVGEVGRIKAIVKEKETGCGSEDYK